jgi:ATP-dependent helicase YprA (DUF1998 family)
MNALANSQDEEPGKFLKKGYPEGKPLIRFARCTGQEKGAEREAGFAPRNRAGSQVQASKGPQPPLHFSDRSQQRRAGEGSALEDVR